MLLEEEILGSNGNGHKGVHQFAYNTDTTRRNEILGIEPEWGKAEWNDTVHLEAIQLEQLEKLVAEKFIDPEGRQNESPTAQEFLDFMRKHPGVVAQGYAVAIKREDYRVTLEGLFVDHASVTPQLRWDFEQLCSEADELDTQADLYSWWD
jgi:hypothetical protein